MRNVTYRDRNGNEYPAMVLGHTTTGEHLAFFVGNEVRIRGPVKNSECVPRDAESWSCVGHVYARETTMPKIITKYDVDDETFLEY